MKSLLAIVIVFGTVAQSRSHEVFADWFWYSGSGDEGSSGGSSSECFAQICNGNPTNRMRSDSQGDGAYLAKRRRGQHTGYDIVCSAGANVYAPFPAKVLGTTIPYPRTSPHWGAVYNTGVLMEGTGSWAGYKIRMFYVKEGVRTGISVSAGDFIGTMINRAAVSRGMINHVHVKLEKNGNIVDPTPYIC